MARYKHNGTIYSEIYAPITKQPGVVMNSYWILKNHYEWCKKEGRDISWYNREQAKKDMLKNRINWDSIESRKKQNDKLAR